ncbi:hypothetical protein OZX73_03485 [Bifidobacterium sp. ESL0775]|uniref:hypothetical protein n=1 Tax=Bifidobacterium sp. ESL0775 TaxID=2983230 RepID=UPI0023F8375A|nr:hypothetical protein [Bifidobacterium sp. ESL0775]WEV69935.1 hypothetical protein OZX73_03485 [Bifidobacterium sp. ESL0775]
MSNTRKPVETVYCHQPDLRHQGGRYTWCGIDRTAHDMRPMSTLPEGYRWESCPVCEAMMLLDQAQRETQRRSRTSTWVQGTLFDGGGLPCPSR